MKFDVVTGDTHITQADGSPRDVRDYDAEFGGPEERKRLEKKLLRKIDARMSILVVIYVLNYVSFTRSITHRDFGFAVCNRVALNTEEKTH